MTTDDDRPCRLTDSVEAVVRGQSPRRVRVFGPAYLDRVVRVDGPLGDGVPIDQSIDGRLEPGEGEGLKLVDPVGTEIAVDLPGDWPGPSGTVVLDRPLGSVRRALRVRCLSWHDDLGGMGAGYAAALGGVLTSVLGRDDDPVSQAVSARLAEASIAHRPIRVPDHPADWTLLISSGPFGDKLPIGFRGCHAAVKSVDGWLGETTDLRVVAGLPNQVSSQALGSTGALVRYFAPAVRNVLDREVPVVSFAGSINLMTLNQREWELLADREEVARAVPIVAITNGPDGSLVRYRGPDGQPAELLVPAFPRLSPPLDTNRAGEAYGAVLVTALLDGGWSSGPVGLELVRAAAERASVAAALVLDRDRFGFPTSGEVDRALREGRVGVGDDGNRPVG